MINNENFSLLVVDDHKVNRELLARGLKHQGFKSVSLAENGAEAIQMLDKEKFDLVLLDIMMPEVDGFGVLAYMKGSANLSHIPVIMISAIDDIKNIVTCIKMGAEDHLPKPFNPVLLKARISASLEKKFARDQEILYKQQIEAERNRADELLHVILPPSIVAELKSTKSVKPRRYENVGVLFSDIVGFTEYCNNADPDAVLSNLEAIVEGFEDLMTKHEMQKIKTIGDSFMATAGLLNPLENPALNCVRCGFDMIATATNLPAGWRVRIGIHVGPVIGGIIGHKSYCFDIWGDTVNLASRIESNGVDGALNVSHRVWDTVHDHCLGHSLGFIPLKGKGQQEIFRIEKLKDR